MTGSHHPTMDEGTIVMHSLWGRGRVVDRRGSLLTIYFPSLDADPGGAERRLREDAPQIQVADDQAAWPAGARRRARVARGVSARVRRARPTVGSLDQAIAWFRIAYPRTFRDPAFINKEVEYKRAGHALWNEHFGGGRAGRLLAHRDYSSVARGLKAVAQSTNIPARNEQMAMNDGLKDHAAAAKLLEALLGFLKQPDADRFESLVDRLGSLPGPAGGSRVLTWPSLTIFPFLADPARFMVLKPVAARKMADRLGWDLPYASRPTWHCFESWTRLSQELLAKLAPLGAEDFIDVQSFLWETRELD